MKLKIIYIYWMWILLISIVSCRSHSLPPSKYIKYCNDPQNKLVVQQMTDSFEYNLQYRTAEYMAIIEMSNTTNHPKLNALINEYQGMEYFILKIRNKYPETSRNFDMKYMSFEFQHAIKMVSLDSIKPTMFHFENTQLINPYYTFLLGFDSVTDSISDRSIRIDHFKNDKAFNFIIPIQAIRNIPNLQI